MKIDKPKVSLAEAMVRTRHAFERLREEQERIAREERRRRELNAVRSRGAGARRDYP